MLEIEAKKQIKATPSQLLETLLDHDNLHLFFNAKIKTVQPQQDGEIKGGRGCIRQVSIFCIKFREQITQASATGIRYRVLNDFPVKSHLGHIRFDKQGLYTEVAYTISCQPPWYLPTFLLNALLKNDINQCLKKLEVFYAAS